MEVAAAPSNDNFAASITLVGSPVSTTGSNIGATKQTGEPIHAGNAGGRSVWWSWTAPSTGMVTITTADSSFDTLLAIYTGSSVSALTAVASSDDFGGTTQSRVSFAALAGTTYRIALDGFGGASGNVALGLTATTVVAGPSTLSISTASAVNLEGHSSTTPFTFTVTRAGNTSGAASVNYAVTGSGANPANAADFGGSLPSGTVSFLATETTKTITVNVSGDTTVEADEGFSVTLSDPSAGATITTASAIGTIQNHDVSPPVLVIVDALGNLTITDFGGVNNNITVTRKTTTNEFVVTATTNQLTANGVTASNNFHIPVALVTGGLIADLRQGNDRLTLTGIALASTLLGGFCDVRHSSRRRHGAGQKVKRRSP